jgi:hypothetical protein
MVFARHLDAALHRLGAGVGEKHGVREGEGGQALGQPLLSGDAVEVGCMPELGGLDRDGLNEMRMRVAEYIHRDAAAAIEIRVAAFGEEVHALPSFECDIGAIICRQHSRHDELLAIFRKKTSP